MSNIYRTKKASSTNGLERAVTIRLTESVLAGVEGWAMVQVDRPSRSQAIRRLLKMALVGFGKGPKVLSTSKEGALRAAELASSVIDDSLPVGASLDEKATRKRKLLKGPSAFRESRRDKA